MKDNASLRPYALSIRTFIIFRGADLGILFKDPAEIVRVYKARHLCDLMHGIAFRVEKIAGVPYPFAHNVSVGRQAEVPHEDLCHIGITDSAKLCQGLIVDL